MSRLADSVGQLNHVTVVTHTLNNQQQSMTFFLLTMPNEDICGCGGIGAPFSIWELDVGDLSDSCPSRITPG